MTTASPSEEAESVLRRYEAFRRQGFDERAAQALARSDVTFHAVTMLKKQGCPLKLIEAILT